jgi:hypothetical protein
LSTTRPTIQILERALNPYAPGAPNSTVSVSISFTVATRRPFTGRAPDELKAFANPSGGIDAGVAHHHPPFAGVNGAYVMAWKRDRRVAIAAWGRYALINRNDVAGYPRPTPII